MNPGRSSFIVTLAGGVGGPSWPMDLPGAGETLAVVVNTGDDFEHWGLTVPDLDTVLYNLAGINNQSSAGDWPKESYALAMMRRYGGETGSAWAT